LRPGSDEIIEAAELPDFDLAGGLAPIEHALNMRTIYLDSRFTAGGASAAAALTDADEDLKSIEAVLQKTNSAGLRLALQKYLAELALLRYSFEKTHFQYDEKDKPILNDRLTKEGVRTAWKELPPVFSLNFEKRLTNLRKSSSDTPPYDILEAEIGRQLDAFYAMPDDSGEPRLKQLELWDFKREIDSLLNNLAALGGSLLASAEEIILAVDALYDLRLGLVDPSAVSGGQLLPIIKAFCQQMPKGFVFTAEEKGYGYCLILSLLKKEPAKFVQVAQRVYDEGYLNKQNEADYYAESSAQLIDFLNKQLASNDELRAYLNEQVADDTTNKKTKEKLIKLFGNGNNVEILPNISDLPDDGFSQAAVLLGKNLRDAIKVSEREFDLLDKDNRGQYTNIDAMRRILFDSEKKYSAAKALLDLYGALVRRRGELDRNTNPTDRQLQQLYPVLTGLFEQDYVQESYYFRAKKAVLDVQYYTALQTARSDPAALLGSIKDLQDTLRARQEKLAAGSTEYLVIEDILNNLNGIPADKLPKQDDLPEDAGYLYAEIYTALIWANLKLNENLPPQFTPPWSKPRLTAGEIEAKRLSESLRGFDLNNESQSFIDRAVKARDSRSVFSLGPQSFTQIPRESASDTKYKYEYEVTTPNGLIPAKEQPNSRHLETTTSAWGFDLPLTWNMLGSNDLLRLSATPFFRWHHIEHKEDASIWKMNEDGAGYEPDPARTGSWSQEEDLFGMGVNLGLASTFARDIPIWNFLTLNQADAALGLGWEMKPWLRTPLLAELYGDKNGLLHNFNLSANLAASVSPKGLENFLHFTPQFSFSWERRGGLLEQEVYKETSSERGYDLEQVIYKEDILTLRPGLGYGMSFRNVGPGDLSFNVTGGFLWSNARLFDFEKKGKDSTKNEMAGWQSDTGVSAGLSFNYALPKVSLGLFGGYEQWFKQNNSSWYTGLEFALPNRDLALTLTVSGDQQPPGKPIAIGSGSPVVSPSGSSTVTQGSSQTGGTQGTSVTIGVRTNEGAIKRFFRSIFGRNESKKK
jgi:hypothetical protein